jgi:hypothetical protein
VLGSPAPSWNGGASEVRPVPAIAADRRDAGHRLPAPAGSSAWGRAGGACRRRVGDGLRLHRDGYWRRAVEHVFFVRGRFQDRLPGRVPELRYPRGCQPRRRTSWWACGAWHRNLGDRVSHPVYKVNRMHSHICVSISLHTYNRQ